MPLSGYQQRKTAASGAFFQADQLPSQGNLTVEADRGKILMLEDNIRRVYCVFAIKQAVANVREARSRSFSGSSGSMLHDEGGGRTADTCSTSSTPVAVTCSIEDRDGSHQDLESGGGSILRTQSSSSGSTLITSSFRRVASMRKKPIRNAACVLDGKQLKCADTGFLVKMLENDTDAAAKMTTLSLRNNSLGNDGIHVILRDLCAKEAGSSLRILDLSGNGGIGEGGARLLARYLASGQCRLGLISLASTGIGAGGGIVLAESLRTAHPTFAELNIEDTGQDEASVAAVVKGMAAHGHVMVRVREDGLTASGLAAWESQCRTNLAAAAL